MTTNIIYLRVSKKGEGLQDLEAQLPPIIEKFNLKDYVVFKEKGSAYKVENIKKRTEFLKILDIMFSANNVTIKDLFLGYTPTQEINLFVWDYHRIMRNFELNLLFSLLCDFFNVNVYSYKQGKINKNEHEKPFEKFARYMFFSINAFSSEDYSWNISENVKKAIVKNGKTTRSRDGKKWGRKFTDLQGNKIILNEDQEQKLIKTILQKIRHYEARGIKQYYSLIIEAVAKKFKIKISKAYIAKLKQEVQK